MKVLAPLVLTWMQVFSLHFRLANKTNWYQIVSQYKNAYPQKLYSLWFAAINGYSAQKRDWYILYSAQALIRLVTAF